MWRALEVDSDWKLLRKPLRNWQSEALGAWIANGYRGTVEVATGAGKTVFALACAELALREGVSDHLLIVAPTIPLVDQWVTALTEDLGLEPTEIDVYSGRHRRSPPGGRVSVMVVNTARTASEAIGRGRRVMLIVDECHRIASPANAKILETATTASLGLSATPRRQYDRRTEEIVLPALGDLIYEYGIGQATDDGVLTPYKLVNVSVPLLPEEEREYRMLSKRIAVAMASPADETGPIERLLRRRARVAALARHRVPVAVRLVDAHPGERSLVFHEAIAAADAIATALRVRGHRVGVYHTRLSDAHRADNLRLYRLGVYDVLVSCRALDEGVNIPETRVAVIASSTRSERQRIQRLGRTLRPAPGKMSATVYTLYAVETEEAQLIREASTLPPDVEVTWQRSTVVARG
jgi:superfamily II DNA or RNA helicase